MGSLYVAQVGLEFMTLRPLSTECLGKGITTTLYFLTMFKVGFQMNKLNVILPNTEEEVYMKISVLISNMRGFYFSNYFNIYELYI